MKKIATKDSWRNYPIDSPKLIKIDIYFTDEQFSKLKDGLIPQQMENKWFIYYENECLHFHRSWTGFEVFKAKLNKENAGYSIKEFWAERDPSKYTNVSDDSDVETITLLIARGLLGIDEASLCQNYHNDSNKSILTKWNNFGDMLFSHPRKNYDNEVISVLFGVAVGDAVGVPYEFSSREKMQEHPATDMIGYGTYNLPPGTWSDDSSLTFCLAESLIEDFNLINISQKFINWRDKAYWTADNHVFDIGITTNKAISELQQILSMEKAEVKLENLRETATEYDNGNGSLMRIIPLLFQINNVDIHQQFDIIWKVSALTHKHIRAAMSCMIYLKLAEYILNGSNKEDSYQKTREVITKFWTEINFPLTEQKHFERLIQHDIRSVHKDDLKSGGYVIEVLESSFWFFLNNENYKNTILSIINIGHDTDTSAAIAGGLAGLYYGVDDIPENWLKQIVRYNDIKDLAERLKEKINSTTDN